MEEFRIALTAGWFDRALSFYRDVVGLSVLQEWPPQEGHGVLFSLEKATLEIIDEKHATWVDTMEVGRRVSGPVRFAVKVSDIRSSLKSVSDAGIQILHEPRPDSMARSERSNNRTRRDARDAFQRTSVGSR